MWSSRRRLFYFICVFLVLLLLLEIRDFNSLSGVVVVVLCISWFIWLLSFLFDSFFGCACLCVYTVHEFIRFDIFVQILYIFCTESKSEIATNFDAAMSVRYTTLELWFAFDTYAIHAKVARDRSWFLPFIHIVSIFRDAMCPTYMYKQERMMTTGSHTFKFGEFSTSETDK